MNIHDLIGMPLRYAKSLLEKENIPYTLAYTESKSRFFRCDPDALYVLRVRHEDDGLSLLVNKSMVMSDSVRAAMDGEENTDAE